MDGNVDRKNDKGNVSGWMDGEGVGAKCALFSHFRSNSIHWELNDLQKLIQKIYNFHALALFQMFFVDKS